jgi:hypothetical protein
MSAAERTPPPPIQVSVWLWRRLLHDLRRGGRGTSESGAFLLGRPSGRKVISYVCYDALDPDAYQHGAITFHAAGYEALGRCCRESNLEVLCDVHTHPGPGVGQSDIDQRHPMLPITGHTALIAPCFARTPWWSLQAVGVYEYLGEFRWRDHSPAQGGQRVRLTLW